ncbi:MAG: outer membrane beta-barrel protein [Elusimicrobiota bacterium]
MLPAIAALSCLLAASNARADMGDWDWLTQYRQKPNMHVGELAFHPYYKLSETYDTNIYLAPPDQLGSGQIGGGVRDSWITGNDLGFEANLPRHHSTNLSLGYDFNSQLYSNLPSVNSAIDQAAHADYSYAGAHGLTYKAGDSFLSTSDQAFSELTQRAHRWMNRAAASIDYAPERSKLTAGVDADDETDKYIDPTLGALLNRYQQDAGFSVGYMVEPKTEVYASYHRQIIHYTVNPTGGLPDSDNKSHSAAAGASGQHTNKISGRIEAGAMYRVYDAAPVSGAPRVARTPTVSTQLTYRYDKDTTAVFDVSRYLQVSIDPLNPFYYSNSAALALSHNLPRKFAVGIDLSVGKNQYVASETDVNPDGGVSTGYRRDDLYEGGLWVGYEMQLWLSARLAYDCRVRNSTLTGQYNYADQRTTWFVKATF